MDLVRSGSDRSHVYVPVAMTVVVVWRSSRRRATYNTRLYGPRYVPTVSGIAAVSSVGRTAGRAQSTRCLRGPVRPKSTKWQFCRPWHHASPRYARSLHRRFYLRSWPAAALAGACVVESAAGWLLLCRKKKKKKSGKTWAGGSPVPPSLGPPSPLGGLLLPT